MTTQLTSRTALRRPLLGLITLALMFGLSACSDDSGGMGPSAPAHSKTTESGGLELTASTPKASYDFGEEIPITVRMENTSGSPITVDFARGRPARYSNIGINVDDMDGLAHHVRGDGERDRFEMQPGEVIRYTFNWDQVSRLTRRPVDRGTFEIIAFSGFDDRETLRVAGLFLELE